MFKLSRGFFAVGAILSGGVSAYTLVLTTCDDPFSGTADTLELGFCDEGTYCAVTHTMESPDDSGIDEPATSVEVTVSFGYVPTTMEISNTLGTNAWCVTKVEWEGGDNILGDDAAIWLDSQTGTSGCIDGLNGFDGDVGACQNSWRFFNLNGASDYMYDVRVKACSGTKSASVEAFFCATYACDGTDEEESITLTMGDEEGGWTATEVPLTFNPIGMRLEEIDDTWCADEMAFNGFLFVTESVSVADFNDTTVDGTTSMIVNNIQANGIISATLAPVEGEEDEDKMFDAVWEIAVTVVGAVLGAVGAAIAVRYYRKWADGREPAEN